MRYKQKCWEALQNESFPLETTDFSDVSNLFAVLNLDD